MLGCDFVVPLCSICYLLTNGFLEHIKSLNKHGPQIDAAFKYRTHSNLWNGQDNYIWGKPTSVTAYASLTCS